jgi:uncharacterized protein
MRPVKLQLVLLILILICFLTACSKVDKKDSKFKPIETEISIVSKMTTIYGSLKLPDAEGRFPIVLIIAGSGPTDRNGNSTIGVCPNSYRMLSDTLAMHGYASLRYDKRGIGKSYYSNLNEADLTFDDYVNDAKKWVEKFKNDSNYTRVFVLGHSEGALIGSIVANQTEIDGFISVSGTAQRADSLILEQLMTQPVTIQSEARSILDSLNQGMPVTTISQEMFSIFRPGIQPYLISWFQYNPKTEYAKILCPMIILHGTTDIQVKPAEAQKLASSNPNAAIAVIDSMNHVLKIAGSNYEENMKTYYDPNLPLSANFCKALIGFLEDTKKE